MRRKLKKEVVDKICKNVNFILDQSLSGVPDEGIRRMLAHWVCGLIEMPTPVEWFDRDGSHGTEDGSG
jgi:hypothetical protein